MSQPLNHGAGAVEAARPVPLLDAPVLVLHLRHLGRRAEISDDAGTRIGYSQKVLGRLSVSLFEPDGRSLSFVLRPPETRVGGFFSMNHRHRVCDADGIAIGWVTSSGSVYAAEGMRVLWPVGDVSWRTWTLRAAHPHRDGVVARADRLGRRPGSPNNVLTRLGSTRLRIELADDLGALSIRRLAVAQLILLFLCRDDD